MGKWLDKCIAARSEEPSQPSPSAPNDLEPGTMIEWDSNFLGHCLGEVAMSPEKGWVVVRTHSVTGNLALVKLDWGVRVCRL